MTKEQFNQIEKEMEAAFKKMEAAKKPLKISALFAIFQAKQTAYQAARHELEQAQEGK